MNMTKLTLDQFKYTSPTAGVNSLVLSYKVPLNAYTILDDSSLMRLRITAKQVFTYSAAQTSDDVTVTVDAPVATVGNLYTGNPDLSLSAVGFWTDANGNTKLVKATAINGTSITFAVNDTTSTTATLTVYYTPKGGSYSWVIVAPTAASTVSVTVLKDSISNVNSINQASPETGLYFPKKVLMTEHFDLQLWVLAPVAVDMDSSSFGSATPNILADVEIPVQSGEMRELIERDPEVKKTAVKLLQEGL